MKQRWADGLLIYFADLRPGNTFELRSEWVGERDIHREVVAIAIVRGLGSNEGVPVELFSYVELDEDACEVANWGPFEALADAVAHFQSEGFAGVHLEEVDAGRDTLRYVRKRLAQRPPER